MNGIRSDCRKQKYPKNDRRRDFGKPDFAKFSNAGCIDFRKTFGTPNLVKTIEMLIRLHRATRLRGSRTGRKLWPLITGNPDLSIPPLPIDVNIRPGRRFHHLTPSCREGMPYHGNEPSNLLLLKDERHEALHRRFGSRTLEEIIILLFWLCKAGRGLWGLLCHWYQRSCGYQIGRRADFLTRFSENLYRFKPRHRRGFFIPSDCREANKFR